MNFRMLIILVLCGFAIAPIGLLMSINAPAILDRLDLAAQQDSLARLQSEQFALNVKVERLKERIASMATLPGTRDIIGHEGDHSIGAQMAEKRFAELVNKWFGRRLEVMEITLLDREGGEVFHLTRGEQHTFAPDQSGLQHGHTVLDFCKVGIDLPVGLVRVSDVEVGVSSADKQKPHVYGISLVTPVAAKGNTLGVLCCKVNMTDFLKDYAMSFWLDSDGNPLHGHGVADVNEHTHHDSFQDLAPGNDPYPGLKARLSGAEAVVWSSADGSKIAWQPILFNEEQTATLWVGHGVDRSELEDWLEAQQQRVLIVVAVMLLAVFLMAGKLAAFVDEKKKEMLDGFEAILAGEGFRPFSWRGFREIRHMAADLNHFAERYVDMRLARQRAEDELRESNTKLEEIVERRTAELFATNEQLSEEVEERSRAEDELIRHRDHLEDLVRQRLVEVAETNEQLQLEMVRRKHAQESVRKNEARLRMILDSVPIGIFIVDRERQTITYANPAAAKMIGAESAAVLNGQFCHAFFCAGDKSECKCIDAGDRFEQVDITLKRQDGSPLSVLKTVIPVTIADRSCLLESITDITDLKRISTQNQALHEQLLQSQKMEAIGVLAGGVAHDFNNLLTIIHGSAELALLACTEERSEYRYLGQIKETTERAGNLVRQLLLFSRTQPMTLSVLQLNDVVENLLKMLKRLIGEDVEIIPELGDGLWAVEGNAANIEQVIMNLTVNGRDAMSDGGGKLYIRTSNVEIDEQGAVAMPEARPGRFVCLDVTDSGNGIEEETMQHIFEPFFTTKEAGKGTGLGLAVVYGIVKQHEGWIDVDSQAGQGTSFKIYLPCSTADVKETAEATAAVELRGEGRRVLVVEDEETLRELIADSLEQKGFRVFQAINGTEACDVFEREQGEFDLLFSDVVLPGEQNGIQLADFFREQRPELPIILSSGYTDQKSQWAIIEERGFAFLQKPFNIGALGKIVYDVIGGKGGD